MPPKKPTTSRKPSRAKKSSNNLYLIVVGLGSGAFLLLMLILYITSGSSERQTELPIQPIPQPQTSPPSQYNPPKTGPPQPRPQPQPQVPREPRRSINAVVMRCIDGDTIVVQPVGKDYSLPPIRMIGIDAPVKATRDAMGQEPHGTEAQQFLSLKVTRQEVRVEFDVVESHEDGLWAYVWLNNELLNETMLKAGWAMLDTRPPNVNYVERLQAAQRYARENQLGIWDDSNPLGEEPAKFAAEIESRIQAQEALEERLSIPKYQPGCVVGNRNTKKFHVQGGQYFDATRTSRYVIYFESPAKARQAGYEASAR